MATHLILEAETILLCFFYHNGRLALYDSVENIKNKTGKTLDQLFRRYIVMGKILKHDFKNSYKEFLIMCVAIIIMSILLGITCLFDLNSFLGRVFFMSSMTFIF